MSALPYQEMEPHNEVVNSANVALGGEAWRTTFALAKPGEAYLIYTLGGGTGKATLAPGRYTATRVAPRDGTQTPLGVVDGGAVDFSLPQGDWGLIYRRPAQAESISPGEDIQARVNAAPPGTTFLLKSGTHRMRSVVPRNGDTFTGEAGTVLSGARLLANLSRSGLCWVAKSQIPRDRNTAGEAPCRSGHARCNHAEDLFLDDAPLLHMPTLAEVGPGKWHFDYDAGQVYLGDDPTGKKVEISVTPKAFTGPATNVTIRNLTIEKYANPTQQATVELGTGWIIEDCESRWNHFTGIAMGPRSIARRNRVHHNGCFGFHGAGDHILVANNEIAHNGFAGYDPFWGAGGSKWVYTSHLIVRDNFSHHNRGPGLWTDINNIHTLYENNTVEDNERGGIFHEISYDAIIRTNTARRNGTGKAFPHWTTGAGIEIVSSQNVEVCGNTLEDNWQGITGLDDHRGTGNAGPWTLTNLNVHGNVVTSRIADPGGGRTGIIDTKGTGAFTASANNRFRENTYFRGTNRSNFLWMGKVLDATDWQRFGQDASGTFRR
ncbi:MAG: right-handed parallel beta-helix repeat-containing protein [Verrucomicrobia bacterium]|nr:right-handed parallel beta-helix repeat-containing protein [Verrucomicrobiota bacterium]